MTKSRSLFLSFGPYLVLVGLGFFLWGPSGYDDSYITYWAAKQWAEFGFLGNINGIAVEQTSSFLHVALLSALYQITGINLPDLGIYLSLAMALACLALISHLARLLSIKESSYPAWFLALSASFSCWAIGGLESTLVAFVILALVLSYFLYLQNQAIKYLALACGFSFLYLLSRPESYFVLLAFLAALTFFAVYSKSIDIKLSKLAILFAVISVLFIAICAARYHYFGQIFPQPVSAKADGLSFMKIVYGLGYFLYTLQLSIIIYTLCAIALALIFLKHRQLTLLPAILLALTLAQVAFVISSGGDWMNAGRFFVPIVALFILLFFYAVQNYRKKNLALMALFTIVVLEVAIIPYVFSTGIRVQSFKAFENSLKQPIAMQDKPWTEKMNIVHLHNFLLADHTIAVLNAIEPRAKPIEILSVQMGLPPFYIRSAFGPAVHFTDMRGLTTRHLTDCPELKAIRQNWLGVFVTYQEYFAAADKKQCQLPLPDLIYDHDREDNLLELLQSRGYKIVYQQQGTIKTAYASRFISANGFIAVSDDLYRQLPEKLRKQNYQFNYQALDN